jgi:glycine/D-amino acid oxidase-like deaminating enzyme
MTAAASVMAGPVALDTDVLIVGGGVAGCGIARDLAMAGAEVLLVDQSDLNTRASGSNAGSLHCQLPIEPFVEKGEAWARAYAPVMRLMRDSVEMWRQLEAELDVDFEVDITGGLIVASTESEMRTIERKAAIERQAGLPIDLLSADDLRRLAPRLSDRLVGGAICSAEGKVNPLRAAPALAAGAVAAGARIVRDCPVTAIRTEAGSFTVAAGGREIRARRVVNAAGTDVARIAAMVGIDLDVTAHPIQVSVTEPVERLLPFLVYHGGARLTMKQTRRGAVLIGGGWPSRRDASGELSVDYRSMAENLRVALDVLPVLAGVHVVRAWPALVNGTEDWMPILGEVAAVPGFFVCSFPWMGLTAGPISARIVADAVLGRQSDHAAEDFRPAA